MHEVAELSIISETRDSNRVAYSIRIGEHVLVLFNVFIHAYPTRCSMFIRIVCECLIYKMAYSNNITRINRITNEKTETQLK